MPAIELSIAERKAHRAEAHHLDPVVMIGNDGLTPAVRTAVEPALNAHGLIKVRVLGDDREAREAMYRELADGLGAAPIQHIGKLLVIYRPKQEKIKEPKTTRGKGLREVVIIKTNPTKKPTIKKLVVKGNERVTAGGNVKRAKVRQTSKKTRALGN